MTDCPECGRERVGVQPEFNKSERNRYDGIHFRIAVHGSPRCLGSRNPIPESLIYTTKDL